MRPGRMQTYVRIRAKREERERARELRARGWPLRRIATEVDVALSSVSVWVRDVMVPPAQRNEGPNEEPPVSPAPSGQKKVCGRCKAQLPIESFNRHPKGRQHWCRDCFRAYFAQRGRKHVEQSERAKARRLIAARAWVRNYLSAHPCLDCGVSDRDVLEFDHVAGKQANISALAYDGASARRLSAEVARCEVVCVNCHRRRTASRLPRWRSTGSELRSQAMARGERRNAEWVRTLLLRSSCTDCGLDDFATLEFDHLYGKTENVGRLARNGVSLNRLKVEVARCQIVCANCHRRRTRRRSAADRARRGLPEDPIDLAPASKPTPGLRP